MPRWRWTPKDLAAWRALLKAVAAVLADVETRGHPLALHVTDLGFASRRAYKALFPTHNAADIASLRDLQALASRYLAAEAEVRPGMVAGLRRLHQVALQILDGAGPPPSPARAQARAGGRRYWVED